MSDTLAKGPSEDKMLCSHWPPGQECRKLLGPPSHPAYPSPAWTQLKAGALGWALKSCQLEAEVPGMHSCELFLRQEAQVPAVI
jgi:hypothetical protein